MARGRSRGMRIAALNLVLLAGLSALSAPAAAQVGGTAYVETPGDALARNVKLLGSEPRSFQALIGAGRAALALGDTMAAAGFFGRAEEVWPASPLPQAGMGAAMAQGGDGPGALQYFTRAMQRGATQSMIGADRGLAYDLLGQHAQAQADYRAALMGRDGDEARRRLALSLAITGKKAEALSTLGPLMARRDAGAGRTRAFVLALTGDISGARAAIEAAMPGSSSQMGYFFQKLPTLRSDQKAAACNLGIFPDSGSQLASVAPQAGAPDRIGTIEQWLSQRPAAPVSAPVPAPVVRSPRVASASLPPTIRPVKSGAPTALTTSPKLWLQLASGPLAPALSEQFSRMKARNRDLLQGISGYVVEDGSRARLLIGPFRNAAEADIFVEDLASVRIDAFTWTSRPGQIIRKLPAE